MAIIWTRTEAGPGSVGARLATHAAVAATLGLLTGWALQFHFEQPPVPLIWMGSAVALAAVFRLGDATAGTVALAMALIHLAGDADLPGALLIGAGTGAAGLAGAHLLRRWRFDPGLARLRDVALLLLVGGGVSAALSALTGSLVMAGLDVGVVELFCLCWVADVMGMLLVGPLLLSARRPAQIDIESIGWLIGVPLVVYAIYAGGLPEMLALPASYGVFPLIMAVALRRPVPLLAAVLAAVAAIAIYCTATGKGPFVQADMRPNILALHAHLAMLALTGLLVAAIRSERTTAEGQAREHLRTLARTGRVSAISTMAAGIAHEINQPLCAAHAYAQTARRLVARGAGAEEVDPVLERIVAGTDKVSAIVRRMRGFLRRETAARKPHDLNALVREAIDLVRPECRRQGVRLEVDLAPTMLPVRADAVELEQVVVNLIQNALEAFDETPAARRWVRLATAAVARTAEFTVTDGGPGLPAGDPAELFEPLVGGREGGSGLGLAIARSIVEAHGGEIDAVDARIEPLTDAPDAGARFRVRLAMAGAAERSR